MVKLVFHSIRILFVAIAVGIIGSHYLMEPVGKPALILVLVLLAASILMNFFNPPLSDQGQRESRLD